MKNLVLGVLIATIGQSFAAPIESEALRTKMHRHLDFLEDTYASRYAPAEWKKKFANWTLEEQILKAHTKVNELGPVKVKDYHNILRDFFFSTKDYHVGFKFLSTEAASLPLVIKSVGSAEYEFFYVVSVNRTKLPLETSGVNIGDELLAVDGQEIKSYAKEIEKFLENNVPETDRELRNMALFSRSGRKAMVVPRGPVTLSFRRKSDRSEYSVQLVWEYTPEKMKFDTIEKSAPEFIKAKSLAQRVNLQMKADPGIEKLPFAGPMDLGNRVSYIPDLGTKVWENKVDGFFHAYTFFSTNTAGQRTIIGMIRIAQYSVDDDKYSEAIREFRDVVQYMQKTTDGLIIDQINNPGGSVLYLYGLASLLSPRPLKTPKHLTSIAADDIFEAEELVAEMKAITNDEEARKALGADSDGLFSGYPASYTFIKMYQNHLESQIEAWNDGKTMTGPIHLMGVDVIQPFPNVQYTKPIMVVVNPLDFSGGDFFPTILQDNNRAKIFGARTAGAGGYVLNVTSPNTLGVANFRYTGSLAIRKDGTTIENLGVTPDVPYELTTTDLTENFTQYKASILSAMQAHMENPGTIQ